MKARCLIDRRIVLTETSFAELVLLQLPEPRADRPSGHKYRLALVSRGLCVMRYDNEIGKGDHVHVGDVERAYAFEGIDKLVEDFLAEAKEWLNAHGDS